MTQPSPHRRFSFHGLITYLLAFSFLVMLISGIVSFLAPSGRISRQVDWTLLGLDRAGWQTIHLSFAVVFVTVGLVHLVFNRKGLLRHLRDRASHHLTLKREAVVALLVTLWLIASAVWALPPASTLHDFNAHFRQTFWAIESSGQDTTTPLRRPQRRTTSLRPHALLCRKDIHLYRRTRRVAIAIAASDAPVTRTPGYRRSLWNEYNPVAIKIAAPSSVQPSGNSPNSVKP